MKSYRSAVSMKQYPAFETMTTITDFGEVSFYHRNFGESRHFI